MLKGKKLNALIAIEIIISMTLYYFVLIGYTAITYAIDIVETNNHNVDFMAYFIDENEEKNSVLERAINERAYLYVDVTVKNEGYFNGIITLNNNNFNIVQEIQSNNIEEISGNTVKLKQINSGTTETVKLLIEAVKQDSINRTSFNVNTEIALSGDYMDSENISSGTTSQISGKTNIQMIWKSSNDISSELEARVLTNSIYELNGEQKRVVQLLINSNIKNNEYPISKTEIRLNAPNNVENVKIFARNNNATNANAAFSENNYEYDRENNLVTINLQNDNEQVISWKKDCKDIFVVTFVLNSNENVENQIISLNSDITTYDQKEVQANCNVTINEEIDGIVTNDLITKENVIYKGKIYTGEERSYQTESKVYVNYSDLINKIIIKEQASKFLQNETELESNIVYKSTIISKENFNSILGDQGYITIKDENGTIIGNINNNTPIDENGNLIISYNAEIKNLVIETSKPIKDGTLDLIYFKSIQNSNLEREMINNLTGINEASIIEYNDKNSTNSNDKIIKLENTSSKARLEVEPNILTAVQKNTNVKMTVVLENNNEKRDLYQNPVVKIKLPSQVKSISAKYKAMYKNGLNISNAHIYKENDIQIIEISLEGTQTAYNTEVIDGTTIIIYADIEIDENAVNSNEEIIMNYTNEIATSFEDNGEVKVGIQIEEIPEELKAELERQRIKALEEQGQFNVSLKAFVGGQELSEGDTVYTGETIKYQITLENNTNADIENVDVQAQVPEGTTYVKRVVEEEYLEESYRKEEVQDRTISNTIEKISCLNNNKIVQQYEVKVNEDISASNIINRLKVVYNNNTIEKELGLNVERTNISLVTLMKLRGSNVVRVGEYYTYYVNIKNLTNEDLNNVSINVITNSGFKLEQIAKSENYEKVSDANQFVIKNIPAGQTITYLILVTAVESNQNQATIYVTANNKNRSNICSEKVEKLSFIANLDSDNKNQEITSQDDIVYKLTIENNGDMSQNYFYIKQLISNYYDVKGITTNGENIEFTKTEDSQDENYYYVEYIYTNELFPDEKTNINVTISPYDIENDQDIEIQSSATVNDHNTDTISHILKKNASEVLDDFEPTPDNGEEDDGYVEDPTTNERFEDDENGENGENENQKDDKDNKEDGNQDNKGEDSSDDNINQGKDENEKEPQYSISGRVWLDENENGQRDLNEKDINDVQITLLNIDTNQMRKANNGSYVFNNLDKGRYIAIFEYDTNKYTLTKYQAENVSKDLNSDVEKNKIALEGKEKVLAITDVLIITGENIANIDLGLVNVKNFDLELSKSISKVTISNAEGTTVKEYDNTALAKVEIAAKYLKNSTVVIEYNINVKNNGEMAGYAKQIVDYKPADLKFNSSLNANWYQSGEYIYSNELENVIIEPGETKELKLILTKEMTETNTGLTNNTAEINTSVSINNTKDLDSTQGNKKTGEDDLGQANIIIGVKTGAAISYLLISTFILIMIALAAYFINKKIQKIGD